MHRVTRATLGTVAIGLLAVFVVAGLVGGGLLGAIHMPGQTAKGSPAGAAKAAPLTPARTYWTQFNTLNWWTTTLLGPTSPVPTSFQFYMNITWGAISNANTKAWVGVWNDSGVTPVLWKTYTLNGTINASNVVTNDNNGVWFSNYTWTVGLNKTSLGCTVASCAGTIPLGDQMFFFTVNIVENGASYGGGMAYASLSSLNVPPPASPMITALVVTYVTTTIVAPGPITTLPAEVQFTTNTSWGYTANASTSVSLEISNNTAPFGVPLNYSFDNLVNWSNNLGLSVTPGFNGTVGGALYTFATWTMWLTNKTLECGTVAACVSEWGTGDSVTLTVWANEVGGYAGAGGITPGVTLANSEATLLGTTFINAGAYLVPIGTYVPLPYVQTGWINVTYVDSASTSANSTKLFGGYVWVNDTTALTTVGYLSLNDSFTANPNWFNGNGVSLMSAFNGTYVVGNSTVGKTTIGYENYTWTWNLAAVAGSLGATVPYNDIFALSAVVYANGANYGGVNQTISYPAVIMTNFVQYPTTASVAFTSPFVAYMPIPFVANYTVEVANAPLSAITTTILVNVTDVSAGFLLLSSTPVAVVDNQTTYQFAFNTGALECSNPGCAGVVPTLTADEFQLSVFIGVNGIAPQYTNGSLASSSVAKTFFLIPTALSASLVAPAPGAAVSVGNVTVSVAYVGTWTAGAVLNIYASTKAIVFTHSMVELTPGVPVAATWFIGQAGVYNYSIVMTTVYAPNTHYFNGTISVIQKGGNVFTNTSKWSNQSIISGLSGAVAGTILLVVGLVVGMIVALVLARAVMGRPAQAPPQPWESKPGAQGAAPNTCSVCGKSFATPEELAAHGKAEHGMQ